MSVLVIGSVAIDTIETPFGKAKNILGGSAVYFSLACSFFNKVKLVAVIGEDLKKSDYALLHRKNIHLEGLKIAKGKTLNWHGKYFNDLNYRETLKLDLGVFSDYEPVIPSEYNDCNYVFLANIDPKHQSKVLNSINSYKIAAADTMDHWIKNRRKSVISLIKKIDILILNDSEARLISKEANLFSASRWIQKKGPKVVVIKKGEHGVLLVHGNKFFGAPAYPLEKTFDPTGAGDAFAGGFMGYLSQCSKITHKNLRLATIYGQVMGSFCVEEFGVKKLLNLSKKDINSRVRELRKFSVF